uniref:Retrotransposon gag domain-containing protein n=1 Tax=Trichogramma kaykai TaxID=54128 RepID=A0ABD2WHU6_9HYME
MCYIEALRRLREKFDFDIEKDRRKFVEELENWIHTQVSQLNLAFNDVDKNHLFAEACRKSQLPDFKLILKKEEIDRLLTDALYGRNRFIWLAIKTGYRDEPDLDCSDGKPVTRRTTALHHAARLNDRLIPEVLPIVHDLFQVYDKFEANYVDEDGLTHLHVACLFGCEDAVEKFLDLGADPNCRVASTGCTTLHLASRLPVVLRGYTNERRDKLVELLLEYGANPNLADARGRTALHWICKELGDDWFLAQILMVLCDERFRPVQLNARDKLGNTPLSLAMESENELLVKYLHYESANCRRAIDFEREKLLTGPIESTMNPFYANDGTSAGRPRGHIEHWPPLGSPPASPPPASPPPPAFDWATIIRRLRIAELLRHWNLSFHGDETDQATWEFLERLGEFFSYYAGDRDFGQQQEILIALPCVFVGPAAIEWYEAWRPKLRTWRDFREAFEARFCDHYREIVYGCRQRLRETMSEFVARLRDIVSRVRHRWWCSEKELVELVFKNVLPEYRYWMRRYLDKIDSLSTLEDYGHMFELLEKEEDEERLLKQLIERLESSPDLKSKVNLDDDDNFAWK